MKINSIAPKISNMIGTSITNLGIASQKSGSMADKLNNFTEGRGMNPGRGSFLALIFSCTLIPRFLKARDADEKSEILRREGERYDVGEDQRDGSRAAEYRGGRFDRRDFL